MKLLRKAFSAISLAVVFSLTFQCASSKPVESQFETSTSFKVEPILFQEWYAGIKVGGTGINVFVSIEDKDDDVTIDSIYFRNLKGKLIKKEDKYIAILKNDSPHYTFTIAEKPEDYPFDLSENECAISFKENGKTKYLKITDINEVAGTYYENGPPSLSDNTSAIVVASTTDDTE